MFISKSFFLSLLISYTCTTIIEMTSNSSWLSLMFLTRFISLLITYFREYCQINNVIVQIFFWLTLSNFFFFKDPCTLSEGVWLGPLSLIRPNLLCFEDKLSPSPAHTIKLLRIMVKKRRRHKRRLRWSLKDKMDGPDGKSLTTPTL